MFEYGDLVRIKKEWRSPTESDIPYRVLEVTEHTKRCVIVPCVCNQVIKPQERVSFEMIEKI